MTGDPDDFEALRPLSVIIEEARLAHGKPRSLMGGYLLGVAVGYLQLGGSTDQEILAVLQETLKA